MSDEREDSPRTRFGPDRTRRWAILRGTGAAVGAVVAGAVVWTEANAAAGLALVLVGVLVGAATAYGLATTMRKITVSVTEFGLSGTVSGSYVSLSWPDVAGWGMGEWTVGRFRRSSSPCLLVWLADHVDERTEGMRAARPLWIRGGRCWRWCRTTYMDGTAEEIEAAMRRFAGDKQRLPN